jgi:hypothetical protein
MAIPPFSQLDDTLPLAAHRCKSAIASVLLAKKFGVGMSGRERA